MGESTKSLEAIKAMIERTDPADPEAQRKLVSMIYLEVCRVLK